MNLMRQILREFGLGEHESPRTLLCILLGAIGGFAGLVLIVFLFEKSPSPELHRNAIISFAILPIVIAFAKNRLAVIAAIVVIIGFRGLVAALL